MTKRPLQIPDRSLITDNTPLRLDVAAIVAFPDGSMTVSGLRRERDAGRLMTEMIAGREFTTLGDIEKMREACRSLRKSRPPRPVQTEQQEIEEGNAAQAHLMAKLDALRGEPSR